MSVSEFTELLKPHYSDALNYCRALCAKHTHAEADDILQKALLKAFENIHQLEDVEKFRSWFFQIITRSFYNALRRPFWEKFISLQSDKITERISFYSDEVYEHSQELMNALAILTEKERTSILLFEIGRFSIKEITLMQEEKSESAVKSRLSRTRKKLKEFMEQLEGEHPASSEVHRSRSNLSPIDLYHETTKAINESKPLG